MPIRRRLVTQSGVLSRSQALEYGLTDKHVVAALRTGRWQRLHDGVYATFSGPVPRSARLWGVVLRAGAGAVLSHQTAAELHGFAPFPEPRVHVTVPSARRVTPILGASVHYSARVAQARLPGREPPRTRAEETVLDLVAAADGLDDAFGWVFRACGSRCTVPDRIAAAMGLRARMRYRPELAAALGNGLDGVHSLLEYRYVTRVERPHGLPRGTRQRRVVRAGRCQYQDVAYDGWGTVVELDGQVAHPAGERWRDVARDNASAAAGQVTLRYGWGDVTGTPCWVAAQVAATLAERGWAGAPRRCGRGCPLPGGS
jgi:hypothetical protein